MASIITVESTANGSYAEGAITITKPTGLAVGDLMVGLFGMEAGNTMTVPSGWTAQVNSSGTWSLPNLEVACLYKVADSSDVAASNFSFDVSDGTGALTGTLFRVSGFNTANTISGQAAATDTSTSSSRSHTIALTPAQTDCILFLAMGCQPNSAVTVTSVSSTGSPTWTEVKDETISGGNFWTGYAAYPSVTEITNVSATLNQSTDRSDIYLLAIRSQVDDSTTLDGLTVNVSLQAPANTVTQSLDQLTINITPNGVTAAAATPDWTNKDKTAEGATTNKNKS